MPRGIPHPALNWDAAKKEIRAEAIKDFIKFAERIKKRDSWFIGGFLGQVIEEWEEREKR
jgi:hypothetical protein